MFQPAHYQEFILGVLRDIKSKEQRFRRKGKFGEKIRFQRQQLIRLKNELDLDYLSLRNKREIGISCQIVKDALRRIGFEESDFPNCLSERFLN